MLHVFYTHCFQKLPNHIFEYWQSRLTPQMQHQISRYRFWHDAQHSLLGKALLISGLEQLDTINVDLAAIQYTAHAKPYLSNSQWSFNISHSGNIVACVLAKSMPVGIDVEKVKPIPLSDFTTLFNNKEIAAIFAEETNFKPFYTLWTQKEAFVKAVGQGLSIPLNEVNIIENQVMYGNEIWYLSKVDLNDQYICHLAGSKPLQPVIVRNISFSPYT